MPSDSPDYALLARYVSGDCTAAEVAQVNAWLADPKCAAEFQAFERIWRMSATRPTRVDTDRAWSLVEQEMNEPDGEAMVRAPTFAIAAGGQRSRRTNGLKIAAAVALVAGAGFLGRSAWPSLIKQSRVSAAPTFNVVSTARGQRLSIRLLDGTSVMLAPSTTLRTPSSYGVRDRTVHLDGEAVFTVTHDDARPFAVHTSRAIARDLGTRFNVRAYGDGATEVVVAEGEVAVHRGVEGGASQDDTAEGDGERATVLTAGQFARVDTAGPVVRRNNVDVERYLAWTRGRLTFHDAPLHEVAQELSWWYDIDVRLGSTVRGSLPVTATFDNLAAGETLRRVALLLGLEVSQADRTFTLESR